MTTHEAEIQQLAKSPLGGQRFDLFIRRYEMNQAPPPEETVPDKFVFWYISNIINITNPFIYLGLLLRTESGVLLVVY
jgi:hypothetical protein